MTPSPLSIPWLIAFWMVISYDIDSYDIDFVFQEYTSISIRRVNAAPVRRHLGPLLLTWINFNPSMDK